jgi:4,5-DOPA dioxygenase extradiol
MFPALFVSHGAPTLPLDDNPARHFLEGLGRSLPRPKVVLAVSAHWQTEVPMLTATSRNTTTHDFYGFPRPLYDLRYEPPGAPDVAADLASRLAAAGMPAQLVQNRGLDHGVWVPLMLMYPDGDIPVIELSIQPRAGLAHHISLGEALRPFREEGLILASGGFVHNLHELDGHGGSEPGWSSRYADWMDQAIIERRTDDLLAYRHRAPFAAKAHPSEDHLLPLFVAYGAGAQATRLHQSATYGSLRMDAYRFD